MFEALLFDLDGTLIDSEPWHKKAEIEAFARFGVQLDERNLDPYMGTTLDHLLKGISASFGVPISTDAFLEIEQPILTTYIFEKIHLFDDAVRFLAATQARKRALVTSSMKYYVDAVFQRFEILAKTFEVVVCAADVERGKPDPEGYLLAASRLNVDPTACLVLEDSKNGFQAGINAGATAIRVDRSLNSDDRQSAVLWSSLEAGKLAEADAAFGRGFLYEPARP